MVDRKQLVRMALIGPIVGAMLGAGILVAHGDLRVSRFGGV